ncbi:glutaminase A [uncultured Nocardioides sp.]|uniref:glutaminase A n=1 Tax=uncultured Nocardioides sp. TaxID=198441 RepID=UPI00262680C9|nr:glutaminase A [uncultured Nocardioides sp.]
MTRRSVRSPVQDYLEKIVDACGGTAGEVAAYIPELAAADPDRFALALATVDGHVYAVGDADLRYSIQSISKPFTYALALSDLGQEAVDTHIDVEPSGEGFNRISLEAGTGRPRNPMINAGAITAASLVAGDDTEHRFERIRRWYSAFADRDLTLDETIHRSELATAHRNRAIAHMLREFDVLGDEPERALDLYVRQCSVAVDTRDLALMAATLANGGVHPRSGARLCSVDIVERTLSVMATCGMYDAAGDWVSAVGMPAKSGVSGGIVAVLPGQVGLAVFSPRLDVHGNSARGVTVLERMSHDMEMHLMHVGRSGRTAVRAAYPLQSLASRRRLSEEDRALLDSLDDAAMVYELHGDLLFAEAERVTRRVVDDAPELVVLDVRRVDEIGDVAAVTIWGLRALLREAGSEMVTVDPRGTLTDPDAGTDDEGARHADLDAAVRWCEDELLRRHGGGRPDPQRLVDEHPLLRDLSDEARPAVEALMDRVRHPEGGTVLEAGTTFAGVHLITEGRAVAEVVADDGAARVLVGLEVGTSFGELALGTDDVQETRVRAVTDLEVLRLSADAIDRLTVEAPEVALEVWRAMCRDGYRVADRALRAGITRG